MTKIELTPDNNPMLWYWGFGSEPEVYNGPHNTREEALAEARISSDEDNRGFTLVRANRGFPDTMIFDGDRVMEDYCENNEECQTTDGGLPGTENVQRPQLRELEDALAATFKAWLDKHKLYQAGWAFSTMDNKEYIPPDQKAD